MPTLNEIAIVTNGRLFGSKNFIVNSINIPSKATKEELCVVFEKKFLEFIFKTDSEAFLISEDLIKHISIPIDKNFIAVKNSRDSLVNLAKIFLFDKKSEFIKLSEGSTFNLSEIGVNSFISSSSRLGNNCTIGSNVLIEANVLIGDSCSIGNNVVIHQGTKIGNNVYIGSGSIIASEGFGNIRVNEKWEHLPHFGNVDIHQDVRIGANCCIDRGTIGDTIIFEGVVIDNLVHIAHNVEIGEYSAIAAKTGIAGSSLIGKRNMIGGMVGIIDHIKTADDVIISATSTVNKDLKEPGTYTGIMPISKHAMWKRIALWITKLDKIAKFLNLKKI